MYGSSLLTGKDIHYLRDEKFYTDPSKVTSPPGMGGTVYFNMPFMDGGVLKDYTKKQM